MSIDNAKLTLVIFCLALLGFVISPVLSVVIPPPPGESFSELWLLRIAGQNRTNPIEAQTGKSYHVQLGLKNNVGYYMYYLIYVKLRNQSEPYLNRTSSLPSNLKPIYEYRNLLSNNETAIRDIVFSISAIQDRSDHVHISGLTIDGDKVRLDKDIYLDSQKNGFFCQLFFELWIYDPSESSFRYDNRFVYIWLNITRSSLSNE